MRIYYEYRNCGNNRSIPPALLDKIVAKFFGGVPDEKKYFMPEGEDLSWTDVIMGLAWTSDLNRWHDRVEMEELVRQLTVHGSMYHPNDTQLYVDLLHYFEHLNLYYYVVFTDQGMFEPYEKDASYMTTDPKMKYTEEEVDEILEYVVSREEFTKMYGLRKLLPPQGFVRESFEDFMSRVEMSVIKEVREMVDYPLELEQAKYLFSLGLPVNIRKLANPREIFSANIYNEFAHRSLCREENTLRRLSQKFIHCNTETEKETLKQEAAKEMLELCKMLIPQEMLRSSERETPHIRR